MLLTYAGNMDSFLQFCTVLIIFIFVLVITWAATKWMANVQKGMSDGANIEIIETHKITVNKYIQIVRVGEKYMAIAICKDTVTMLTEISAEEIKISEQQGRSVTDFKKIFELARKEKSGPKE